MSQNRSHFCLHLYTWFKFLLSYDLKLLNKELETISKLPIKMVYVNNTIISPKNVLQVLELLHDLHCTYHNFLWKKWIYWFFYSIWKIWWWSLLLNFPCKIFDFWNYKIRFSHWKFNPFSSLWFSSSDWFIFQIRNFWSAKQVK